MRLVVTRIVLLVAAAAATALVVSLATGAAFSLALTPQLSALYFIPVNIACLVLLRHRLRAAGPLPRAAGYGARAAEPGAGATSSGLRTQAGYDPSRLGRDTLLGLLWLCVLFVPFALALNLAMLVLFGPGGMLGAYETVFAPDPSVLVEFSPWFAWASALATALLFPITNAPAEELVYRGHAQGGLFAAGHPAWFAVGLPALAFGTQHVLLAPSAAGMVVYGCAFFAWGLGAGIIYRRHGRLMPLIIAHFVTNLLFAVAPLVILLVDPF